MSKILKESTEEAKRLFDLDLIAEVEYEEMIKITEGVGDFVETPALEQTTKDALHSSQLGRAGAAIEAEAAQVTIKAQAEEIAELNDKARDLDGLHEGKNLSLNIAMKQIAELKAENTELRKAIQAIDDIVYEECDAGMMGQIWAIVEGIKEVK